LTLQWVLVKVKELATWVYLQTVLVLLGWRRFASYVANGSRGRKHRGTWTDVYAIGQRNRWD